MKSKHHIGIVILICIGLIFVYIRVQAPTPVEPVVEAPVEIPVPEPASTSKPIETPVSTPSGPFSLLTLTTETPGKEISDLVGFENVGAVLALNRLDDKHLNKGMTVVVPSSFDTPAAFASFPTTIAELNTVPKIMLVSQRVQAFAIYENGTMVRSGPVSTGKKSTPSPSKLYYTNWKGKLVTSSIDPTWIMPWYFNLDNKEGISLHQYDLPGYPASHACIRMYEWDAKFIYDWADQWKLSPDGNTVLAQGTPVLLFDTYAYGQNAPWKNLVTDINAIKVTDEDLKTFLTPHLAEITPAVVQ